MTSSPGQSARIESALAGDGFAVKARAEREGALGLLAEHREARGTVSGAPKRVILLQGSAFQRGWQMGRLAEPDVSRMCGEYEDRVVFAFFDEAAAEQPLLAPVRELLTRILVGAAAQTLADIPAEYLEEIDGIVEGCRAADSATTVHRDRLIALNVGIDALLAHVYTGRLFRERGALPHVLRTPIGCNAFVLTGPAAAGRVLFGRDFMFPTAGIFQDTACLVVCLPARGGGLPFVSQAAPGFVGSMTGMNAAGLAMGVNMLPSSLCDPARPGLNSLLLVRDCVQHCGSAAEAVERIRGTRRGVSWLYPVADAGGAAFMVEAGRSPAGGGPFPDLSEVPAHYRRLLQEVTHADQPPRGGLVARGPGWRCPAEYLSLNERMWQAWSEGWTARLEERRPIPYPSGAFGERGFINARWTDRSCPGPFYFAPQRVARSDLLLATNHCLCPEMRITAMTEWIALLTASLQNDIQWRYDELNREILEALDAEPGGIGEKTAWDIIDFLRPDGRFPRYYNDGP
ncbi:MAG TPA: C45 family autoproteolytic acyltransferase/hydrolase, partial [Spirochaetia bacterium]|nr:C45 family autoproteolytic acyltransferase/hydrolase [Spirochaetia bacterium]